MGTDPTIQHAIESQLQDECGSKCLDVFHEMLDWAHTHDAAKSGLSWASALEQLMKREYNNTVALYTDVTSSEDGLTSFVEKEVQTKSSLKTWIPFDTPCYDAASCKAAELLANKCNYGRVATLATYQAVNLAVHVFGVIMQVLCGVVHVHKFSLALASSMVTCQMPANLLAKLV